MPPGPRMTTTTSPWHLRSWHHKYPSTCPLQLPRRAWWSKVPLPVLTWLVLLARSTAAAVSESGYCTGVLAQCVQGATWWYSTLETFQHYDSSHAVSIVGVRQLVLSKLNPLNCPVTECSI